MENFKLVESFQCPKCLCTYTYVTYREMTNDAREFAFTMPGWLDLQPFVDESEYLIIKCRRCEYSWFSATADSENGGA